MTYKAITFDLASRIATVTLNRPDRLNAINEDMRDDFTRLFGELQTNEDIGVVIFTGAGRAFSAGGDIGYFEREWSTAKFRAENHRLTQFFDELELIEKPVLAAINGPCTGAGLQITLSCDIRIASDQAEFGFRENNIGLIPGAGEDHNADAFICLEFGEELHEVIAHVFVDGVETIGAIERDCRDPIGEVEGDGLVGHDRFRGNDAKHR